MWHARAAQREDSRDQALRVRWWAESEGGDRCWAGGKRQRPGYLAGALGSEAVEAWGRRGSVETEAEPLEKSLALGGGGCGEGAGREQLPQGGHEGRKEDGASEQQSPTVTYSLHSPLSGTETHACTYKAPNPIIPFAQGAEPR